MPTNAPEWAKFLTRNPLPSPFKVGRLALKSLEKEAIPYSQLATTLNADPVLSFYLMEEAAREATDTTEYSKTLDHAMSMIGVDAVKETIKRLPVENVSMEEVQSLYFVKMLTRSLYAAHLAKKVAQIKGAHNPDDVYWAALFVYVPLWFLWRFATPEMRLLRYAIHTNHKGKVQAQQEVLSCSIEEISTELVNTLALPPIVKACFQQENQPSPRQWVEISRHQKTQGQLVNMMEDRRLKMLIQQPMFSVQMVKLLADAAMDDWYSKTTKRAQQILAAYLDITLAEAVRLTHEVAADMSRAHPLPGILLPAARLFLPTQPKRAEHLETGSSSGKATASSATANAPEEAAKPQTAAREEAPRVSQTATQSNAPKAIYTQLVTAMYKTPEDFSDLHELMNGATSALVYGLGLGRATASLINKERTRIKTYYATGCQEHAELAGYDARLVKGTIFSKLSLKPASVWIKPSSDDSLTSLVPLNFKQVVEIEDYFLMSVFVNEKPFAVVYCDAYPDQKLTETDYKYFKYLCKGVSLALDYLVRNKAKKNTKSSD